ncbi:MAG: VCBS repeat-containing protein, partial [Pirellulales bacterium]|nr:VCBS repeat-containing protein [Pirellulales bacterium]
MDYNNDGILDLISGSYDPGDLYLSLGQGDGKYAAMESIVDKNGLPLVHHPEELASWQGLDEEKQTSGNTDAIMLRVASFGSWPTTVDWDADGDLDMLIGSFGGQLFLRKNVGTRAKPEYDPEAIQIQADGKPLQVEKHAAPVIADWNQDGKWDLVVGSGDGAVGWFENVGTAQAPKFGKYNPLVAPGADSKFLVQYIGEGELPGLGVRAQICVTDYDQDGTLDLIVGDYSDVKVLRELNDEEIIEQAKVQKEIEALMAESAKVQKKYSDQYEETGEYDDEAFQEEMKKFPEAYEKLAERDEEFIKESRRASFIWLFRGRGGDAPNSLLKKGADPLRPF